jgi:mycobactin lysine-N-oxygenase
VKASALRKVAKLDLKVTIFERSAFGSAWDGRHGFTDGEQLLCTSAERDLGFPYARDTFGLLVAEETQARASWQAFAVREGLYHDWVDKGRRPLPHGLFAQYVDHVIRGSGAAAVFGEVIRLEPRDGKWQIHYRDRETAAEAHRDGFDAVVVTGTGPPRTDLPQPPDSRIFDGQDFWRLGASIPALVEDSRDPIVIVGSGGTSAAIAAKLEQMRLRRRIVILGTRPTLYARVDSFFENRVFTNPATWSTLSKPDRRAFTERLARGAVWANVLDGLVDADLEYRPAKVTGIRHEPLGDPGGELMVDYETPLGGSLFSQPAAVVVDATGFDLSWFADLLPDPWRQEIRGEDQRMREEMDSALRLPLVGTPPLHAPMLSQVVGPGFSSLMALGDLSDAILRPYVEALT